MCLAIPVKIIEIRGKKDDFMNPPVALVEVEGARREIRLDIVDRWPSEGDYVIVHAGFAIHTLDPEEAEANLNLLKEMAQGLGQNDAS